MACIPDSYQRARGHHNTFPSPRDFAAARSPSSGLSFGREHHRATLHPPRPRQERCPEHHGPAESCPNGQSSARSRGFDERRVPGQLPEPDAVIQPARLRMPRRAQAGDRHVSGPGRRAPDASVQKHRPSQPQTPVVRMCPDRLELSGPVHIVELRDRRGCDRSVRRLHQNVQVAAVRCRPSNALVGLFRVRRGSPGVRMCLDRGLRPGLIGGAEPKSMRQLRLFHVGEVPLVKLGQGRQGCCRSESWWPLPGR